MEFQENLLGWQEILDREILSHHIFLLFVESILIVYPFYDKNILAYGIHIKFLKNTPITLYLTLADECMISSEKQIGKHQECQGLFWNTIQSLW